jgi:hypothetical protein
MFLYTLGTTIMETQSKTVETKKNEISGPGIGA